MMISDKMSKKLNEQITAEFGAAHLYLAMACVLDEMGLKVLSKWFERQSAEEREHAMKLIHYLRDVGAPVVLESVSKPSAKMGTVMEIARSALESEQKVTKMIHDLVALADEENDYATRSFLKWFVDEQVEEVATMTDLQSLVELAGSNVLQIEARLQFEMMSNK